MENELISKQRIQKKIAKASLEASYRINLFSGEVLVTKGGRIGSGMGTLLEALWGYFANQVIYNDEELANEAEIAWMYGHEYNDFACTIPNKQWNPETREGEILRIEAKSMVAGADESKAHFDQIVSGISDYDLLVIIVWKWADIGEGKVSPQIIDQFVGTAKDIATFRDQLHITRGGSFVSKHSCPDGCVPEECKHDGEPLNASGIRERSSGPEACKGTGKATHANNFGGMVRMLKTNSEEARKVFRKLRSENDTVHGYISFIHRNFPKEEVSQYTTSEWRTLADLLDITDKPKTKQEIAELIRKNHPDYQEQLRDLSTRVIKEIDDPSVISTEVPVVHRSQEHDIDSSLNSPQTHATPSEARYASVDKLLKILQS